MKMFNEMSLRVIRRNLEKVGVEMTDEQFNALTYSELRKVYKKSKKAYELYKQVDAIIDKKKAPTPAVPMGQVVFSDTPSSPEGEFRIGEKKKTEKGA